MTPVVPASWLEDEQRDHRATKAVLKVERDEARAILRNFVAGMGVDDIDPRLDYVMAQIGRVDLEAVRAYIASFE